MLHPERTAGGQRRYSELDVARVEWLKERLARGLPDRRGRGAARRRRARWRAPSRSCATASSTRRSRATSTRSGSSSTRRSRSRRSKSRFAQVLTPALVEVGERWATGRRERRAGAPRERDRARGAAEAALRPARQTCAGRAVLACAPGERHEIGLLMLAVLLRSDGWQVAYLGADTPFGDAVALADELDATALCFSAATNEIARELAASSRGSATRVPHGDRRRPRHGTATCARRSRDCGSSPRESAARRSRAQLPRSSGEPSSRSTSASSRTTTPTSRCSASSSRARAHGRSRASRCTSANGAVRARVRRDPRRTSCSASARARARARRARRALSALVRRRPPRIPRAASRGVAVAAQRCAASRRRPCVMRSSARCSARFAETRERVMIPSRRSCSRRSPAARRRRSSRGRLERRRARLPRRGLPDARRVRRATARGRAS